MFPNLIHMTFYIDAVEKNKTNIGDDNNDVKNMYTIENNIEVKYYADEASYLQNKPLQNSNLNIEIRNDIKHEMKLEEPFYETPKIKAEWETCDGAIQSDALYTDIQKDEYSDEPLIKITLLSNGSLEIIGKHNCDICKKLFPNKRSLTLHENGCKKSNSKDCIRYRNLYSCVQCSYSTVSFSKYRNHYRIHTNDKPFSCPICDYKSSQRNNVVKHIKLHMNDKKYICDICDYKAAEKYQYEAHLRKHTGEKPFKCNICTYETSQPTYLSTHMSMHKSDKRYKCDMCDYTSVQKSNLNKHKQKHAEKKYICDDCGFKTNFKHSLKRHVGLCLVKFQKDYLRCSICSFKCVDRSILSEHSKTHINKKMYVCDICSYTSNKRENLRRHMSTHDEKRTKYSCHICPYKVTKKQYLLHHLSKHETKVTSKNEYMCDLCSYKTNQKDYIRRHMSRHTVKSYACNICNFKCDRRSDLIIHKKQKHTIKCNRCGFQTRLRQSLERHLKTCSIKT